MKTSVVAAFSSLFGGLAVGPGKVFPVAFLVESSVEIVTARSVSCLTTPSNDVFLSTGLDDPTKRDEADGSFGVSGVEGIEAP